MKPVRAAIVTVALGAAAFIGAQLAQPAAAQAAAPIPTTACAANGATQADKEAAERLSPKLQADLAGNIDAYQVSCARAIVDEVQARGLDQDAAQIAVATSIVETHLHNYTLAVDYDSLGLFQQRPSAGWGSTDELIDPAYATDAFLDRMEELYPNGSWKDDAAGDVAQRVQVSAFPDRYGVQMDDAATIVAELWSETPAPLVG